MSLIAETAPNQGCPTESANTKVPFHIAAILDTLAFRGRSLDGVRALDASVWASLLTWCDRRQITLLLYELCGDALDENVAEAARRKLLDFHLRMARIRSQLDGIAKILDSANIPFVVLKGFTHCPDLCPEPVLRAQGDIDLWCEPSKVAAAYAALLKRGYQAGPSHSRRHLPPLRLPSPTDWNGNLADLPISIELHHSLWCDETEHIRAPGTDAMWTRREARPYGGRMYNVLAPPDLVGFAALHVFLHLTHGDLPLQRVWEIANFLHNHSHNEAFWDARDRLHSPEIKRIGTIVFQIAAAWFRCDLPERIKQETLALPASVQLWLEEYAFAPLLAQSDGNKNHVWLRFSMSSGLSSRFKMLQLAFPAVVNDREGPAAALSSLTTQGLRWLGKCAGFTRDIGPFLLASALFDVGEFLFVLLYSLYLLALGYREDVIGLIAAAMTTGALLGSPLAAMLERKIGLRGLLMVAAFGGSVATALRIAVLSRPLLVATAVLNGLFFAFWAVAFPPVVAAVTRPRSRSVAFGLITAMGMSIGILIGVLGVRLPEWISTALKLSSISGMRIAIVLGCILVLLAAIPASRLNIPRPIKTASRAYPRGRFIQLFLAALFLWMLATSSLSTFGIPFLSLRLHLSTHQVGTVFSTGQLLQVAAMLCGPLLVQRMGEREYVVFTAIGTAAMLLLLAVGPPPLAVGCYLACLTLQYMNEPSLFALLMNRVSEVQRSGASSLMFITMSIAGTVAAAVAGGAIVRLGYSTCLFVAAIIAVIAALLFSRVPDLASGLHNDNN